MGPAILAATPHLIALGTGLLAWAGVMFCALALWAARSYVRAERRQPSNNGPLPPVSILKPLKGLDPGLLGALETHLRQDYPSPSEIIFGVSSLDDPAVAVIDELRARWPGAELHVVQCPLSLGANGKASNVAQMIEHARYEHLLIGDGDISVGPGYLRAVMGAFARRDAVGLVTVPYRGRAAARPTLGARLEVLAIATDFFPGVLTARLLERGVHFGMGSTLATTRTALARIGGMEPLAGYLGDDYELGARVTRAGMRVEMPLEVVETAVGPYTLRGFWEHQMRWARSMRDSRRWGYLGVGLTYPVPWAALCVLASGGAAAAWALLAIAVLARVLLAAMVGLAVLGDRAVARDLPLVPLRDCAGLLLWAASYAGNTVLWRGERFRVQGGRLVPAGGARR